MQIERIDPERVQVLESFLASCGSALESFRYFSNRPFFVLKNHLVTLLGFDENRVPVAYGHLDKEEGTVWLGICVSEGNQGRGYGNAMMQALLNEARAQGVESISLTVDATNSNAARLYEKFGFVLKKKASKIRQYRLNLSEK